MPKPDREFYLPKGGCSISETPLICLEAVLTGVGVVEVEVEVEDESNRHLLTIQSAS